MIKKPVAKKKRKNVAPASPRFMPSSHNGRGAGQETQVYSKATEEKEA